MNRLVVLLVALLAVSQSAMGNQLADLGVKNNYKDAETVVIGRITGTDISFDPRDSGRKANEVEVEVVMKGGIRRKRILVPYLYAEDMNYAARPVGERCMYFLTKYPLDGVYVAVDGRYSIFKLENPPAH